jgi:hypothetical protein
MLGEHLRSLSELKIQVLRPSIDTEILWCKKFILFRYKRVGSLASSVGMKKSWN